jgi:hypothetical protein
MGAELVGDLMAVEEFFYHRGNGHDLRSFLAWA